MNSYQKFQDYVGEINDLLCAASVLNWDAHTQMPPNGASTRGRQLATLTQIAQERFVSEQMARLLDGAEAAVAGENADSYRLRSVFNTRQAYEVARRIPIALVSELTGLVTVAQVAWHEAKVSNDFEHFAPYLTRIVRLNQELAEAIGYPEHPYDALLLRYEPGMTAARLRSLFDELRAGILPLVKGIQGIDKAVRWDFLTGPYPAAAQKAFGLEIAQAFGYDLVRGRLDEAPHPFEVSFTREDVRITTRYQEDYLSGAIFGIFHEAGHALYEMGVDPALTRSALTTDFLGLYAVGGASFGTHESQSRLWENQVGRSRSFWQRHFPRLTEYFPEQLAGVDGETFYRAVNRVNPSFIRVEADEVTYNLHIMLRAEIEMALIDGSLAVADLPEIWNAKMGEYLGVTPPTDTLGVLQDIHWSTGYIGSFPTYTIGNVMSAQFFQAAHRDIVDLESSLAAGDYRPLHDWLIENVYRHGRAFTPEELLQRSTGAGLDTGAYLAYLQEKFTELYAL